MARRRKPCDFCEDNNYGDYIEHRTEPAKGISIIDRGGEFGFEFELRREDKRIWSKILMMPRYKATEWMFPRKKKRGTMRRKRRE